MNFIPIDQYMKLSKEERQRHLRLSEPCIEIGGGSQQFRGLLAHAVGTMISTKREALCCHACHNQACSNPRHLYWGTYTENLQDAYVNGRKSITAVLEEKYGVDGAREIRSMAGRAPRKKYGNRFTKK